MPDLWIILKYAGIVAAMVLMAYVVRTRRRQYHQWLNDTADEEICEHLRPALAELRRRGHVVCRVGMRAPNMPLEIHVVPAFNEAELAAAIHIESPARVSDRRVLYCAECWCELRG